MNLTGSNVYRSKKPEDGFTFMEVIAAMAIMSILGVTVWMGFAAAVNLIQSVPVSVELVQSYMVLDTIVREYISRVKPPFWQPELDYYMDSTSVIYPFYEGVEEQFLQIEYLDNHLYLSTNARDEDEEEDEGDSEEVRELYRSGPFSYIYFSEISEKGLGIIGLEITLKPEHEKIDEFTIFARIGGHVFEKP
jgi:prepilin-type N-terminal cleavage/methylation domain-containing protein